MKINYSFFFLCLFSLYIGYFNYLLLFLLSLLIHEIGHLLFIKIYNIKINSFSLSLYGGCLNINQIQYNSTKKYKKLLIYSGGVFLNSLCYLLFKNTLFSKINLIYFIFNLLPIYPLDGYNILKIFIKNNRIINDMTILLLTFLIIICIYFNSIGLLILTIIIFYKNIKHCKQNDKQYLTNLILNMV